MLCFLDLSIRISKVRVDISDIRVIKQQLVVIFQVINYALIKCCVTDSDNAGLKVILELLRMNEYTFF